MMNILILLNNLDAGSSEQAGGVSGVSEGRSKRDDWGCLWQLNHEYCLLLSVACAHVYSAPQ